MRRLQEVSEIEEQTRYKNECKRLAALADGRTKGTRVKLGNTTKIASVDKMRAIWNRVWCFLALQIG